MRVLLITYYWPPSGGSGVQRWLKFVKYLPQFGVEPVIYTVKNPQYAIEDDSLLNEVPENIEVLKESIWEPNNLFSKFSKKETASSAGFLDANPSFIQRQLQYIRANYFIPDARKFWIKPSVDFLTTYLSKHKVDLVISTGPPHSVHLIADELKQKLGLKWVSDFRDPWTNIDYFQKLPLTKRARLKHELLEKKVVRNSDAVLVVGKSMKEEFEKYNDNVHVLTNGYDTFEEDGNFVLDKKFSISHIGLMNTDRNPMVLWSVLGEMISESEEFAKDLNIRLIGKYAQEIYSSVKSFKLKDQVEYISYMPHSEVLKHQRSSQVLLLSVNRVPSSRSIITGKVFEYMQSKRPILGIGPVDGDLAEILNKTKAGVIVDFDDTSSLKAVINEFYFKFKKGQLEVESIDIDTYHRKNLTKKLVEVLKNI